MLRRTRAALAVAATACLSVLGSACTSPSPQPEPQSGGTSDETTATPTATVPPTPSMWNGLTGDEIITQARDALRAAPSYRVEGTVGEGGGQVTLDLVYAGDRRQGTRSQGGASAEVIQIEEATYVRGNVEFWERVVYSQTAELLVEAWVELDGPYATFGAALVPDIGAMLTPAGVLQPGEETTINGQPAVTLTDGTTTVAVAIEDPRYPLRIVAEDGTRLELGAFGELVTIEAPADVLSLADATGSG